MFALLDSASNAPDQPGQKNNITICINKNYISTTLAASMNFMPNMPHKVYNIYYNYDP
jgi:hypothetical protein